MDRPSIIPRRPATIAGLLLAMFILFAAAVNVPWAVTFIPLVGQIPVIDLHGARVPREWPATTPHATPWPAPESWYEGSAFGCKTFNVTKSNSQPDHNGFQMELQQFGWPFPVIEKRQFWWDWDDPKLKGPENDPPLSLLWRGLLLNPIILGGTAWIVFVLPWITAIAVRRLARRRLGRCMACGYPIGVNPVCTECGSDVGDALSSVGPNSQISLPEPSGPSPAKPTESTAAPPRE